MSRILSSTAFGLNTDEAPIAKGHVGKIMLSYFLRTWCCWWPQGCCRTCLHVAVLDSDVAGEDAGQLWVVDVGVEELLLDNGLPDGVELVGFCQESWDVEMATDVLKKFLMTLLLQIVSLEDAQIEFDVVVDQVADAKNWGRDVADV